MVKTQNSVLRQMRVKSALPGYYYKKTLKVTCLRPCVYMARKAKDDETMYSAYNKEALVVSITWIVYFIGCKCSSVVTDHASLVHLLKESSDKLTDMRIQWVIELMPYFNLMHILYSKGVLNETYPASKLPDFLPIDNNMCGPYESL